MVDAEFQPCSIIPETIFLLQHRLEEQWRKMWAVMDPVIYTRKFYDVLDLSAENDSAMLD